ncbi:hypothetical protein EG327_000768 [Venturia inaequalis]|uniref:Candidate secreted effector protein n=1 Tax=Venturia inaequalis TaxID=5025 RepID=A0A8H3U9R5_VENIN|nr:hypothetical protein EG327_000768 [Venturia inaequalis]
MKFTFNLLVISLANLATVSADTYELCCCTKLQSTSHTVQCDHDTTKKIVDLMYGHFAFTKHYWESVWSDVKLKYDGSDYIYATGKDGDDTVIGAKEMRNWCKKWSAGHYCWSPGNRFSYNYKGELVR